MQVMMGRVPVPGFRFPGSPADDGVAVDNRYTGHWELEAGNWGPNLIA